MSINLIVACDHDFAIGCSKSNSLPYYIKNDLKRFKELTTSHYVIMGRTTFESLKNPLSSRTNVVVSRDKNFKVDESLHDKYDIIVENDLVKILNHYKVTGKQEKDLWIIGGSQIYSEAIHWCDKIYMTMIHNENHPDADVYFNKAELSEFKIIHKEKHFDEESILYYSFIDYERKTKEEL